MENTKKSFRLIVIKRPYQAELPGMEENDESGPEHYRVIATNFPDEARAEDIARWYNKRGDSSENRIKELKNDFGMERMPSGDFGANAVFFSIGVMAYNLHLMFKTLILCENYRNVRVLTTRWRLFNRAGRIVYHARQVIMKVSGKLAAWFGELRTRIYELSLEVSME